MNVTVTCWLVDSY